MSTQQPVWKFVANLGDANPIDEGGLFVYVDETGVYQPEAEKLIPPTEDSKEPWEVRRFILEPCTYVNGVLSDNRFHQDHPAWFAERLEQVAAFRGITKDEMVQDFLSADVCVRAWAWEALGEYFGWDNLDAYPLTLTDRSEVVERYAKKNACKPSQDSQTAAATR